MVSLTKVVGLLVLCIFFRKGIEVSKVDDVGLDVLSERVVDEGPCLFIVAQER